MSVERYSAAVMTVATGLASGGVYAALLAGASDPISVRSIRVTNQAGVGLGPIALARAAGVGTGIQQATAVAHRTLGGTAEAKLFSVWNGALPSGTTPRLAQEVLPAGTGTTRELWDAEKYGPLVLEPRGGLVVVNQGSGIASGSLVMNFTWEEGRR